MSRNDPHFHDEPAFAGTLNEHELLAFRLEIDSRIKPGSSYRIRPTDRDTWLFAGRPVRLVEIRPAAYCFRMTFDVPGQEDPTDSRTRCVYTDSWQPAAIALSPVADGEAAEQASPRAGR